MRYPSGRARKYFLSVRLSNLEVKRYAKMLEWFQIDHDDENLCASDRFRMLLDKFCAGMEVLEGPMKVFEQFLRRPPKPR